MRIRYLEVDASLAKERGRLRQLDRQLVNPDFVDERRISEELHRARAEIYAPSALHEPAAAEVEDSSF